MTNKEKIEAIKKWQKSNFTHELTCGNYNCNEILEPLELNKELFLACPECSHTQNYIPECIYNVDYEKLEEPYKMLNNQKNKINYQKEIDNISKWLKEYLEKSGCNGYVVLASGGIDSSVVASLCCKAVGSENVIAVALPCETREDMNYDAQELANNLGVEFRIINLEETYNSIVKGLLEVGELSDIAKENIKSRLRMVAGYGIANTENYLLAGTGNLSEDSIAYFTKFGDGGVDILPIYNYYKTEVYKIAELMPEIPDNIKTKAPSADLSLEQTDEKDIGMSYSEIDKILKGLDPNDPQSLKGLDIKNIEKIKDMIKKGKHKNELPPKCPRL